MKNSSSSGWENAGALGGRLWDRACTFLSDIQLAIAVILGLILISLLASLLGWLAGMLIGVVLLLLVVNGMCHLPWIGPVFRKVATALLRGSVTIVKAFRAGMASR